MVKRAFMFHVLPIVFSLALIWGIVQIKPSINQITDYTKTITGVQSKLSGRYSNFDSGDQAEIDLLASIKNKAQLTLFGSSEFSDSPICPYNFFPDSLGMPVLGFGHAYHQHLSIFSELLVANEFLENSKICIFLSPGWFEAKGTNPEAFIEFIRPNFLKKVLKDNRIEHKYKDAIGHYIYRHYKDFVAISNPMEFMKDEYLMRNSNVFNSINAYLRRRLKSNYDKPFFIEPVSYEFDLIEHQKKLWNGNMKAIAGFLQKTFIDSIVTNDIYVNDDYFITYLEEEDGTFGHGTLEEVDIPDNQEFKDFKLLIEFVKSRQVNCSFVIIPLNPYYYSNTDVHIEIMDSIRTVLNNNSIPFLDMYAISKETYEPGILTDVMHLGDYGWMKVNQFLDSIYYGSH